MSKNYFKNFTINGYDGKYATNIISRSIVLQDIINNTSYFYEFILKEFMTPEQLSNNIYGDPQYYWVILLMNNVIDPYYDWVLQEDEVFKYVTEIYGKGKHNELHHYEDPNNERMVDADYPNAIPITNLENAMFINDAKRNLKILHSLNL